MITIIRTPIANRRGTHMRPCAAFEVSHRVADGWVGAEPNELDNSTRVPVAGSFVERGSLDAHAARPGLRNLQKNQRLEAQMRTLAIAYC